MDETETAGRGDTGHLLREVRALGCLPAGGRLHVAEAGQQAVLFCLESTPHIRLRMEDNRAVFLQRGDILLLREPFTVVAVPPRQVLKSVFVLLEGEPIPVEQEGGVLRLHESFWARGALEVLEALNPEDLPGYCRLKIPEMLYLLERKGLALSSPRTDPDGESGEVLVAQQGEQYIRGHLSGDLSIEQIARSCGVSPTTLKKCWRNVFGSSVHHTVVHFRMEEAERLLTSTPLTVEQVSARTGYASTSQFSTVFLRTYGTTPARYREKKV